MRDLHREGGNAVPVECWPSGEQLVEDRANRKEVGPAIYFPAQSLLGAHVTGRAEDLPHLGHHQTFFLGFCAAFSDTGDPEVQDLYRTTILSEYDV